MGDAIIATASLATSPLLPILWLQGRHVRKTTPRLPGAAGPSSGVVAGAGPPLRLLVVGESTVAGVGAPDHAQALTGQIAAALAEQSGRGVSWRACGMIGASAATARRLLLPGLEPEPADIMVLALGVNDVLELNRPGRWARDLARLIADLRGLAGPAPVVLAAVPPMGRFPALPQPLRAVLGLRAHALDRAARRLAPSLDRVTHSPARLTVAAGMFCADRFHPSVQGYRRWGGLIAGSIAPLISLG